MPDRYTHKRGFHGTAWKPYPTNLTFRDMSIVIFVTGLAVLSVQQARRKPKSRFVPILTASNDGLSSNLANVGVMLNKKNVFFVPMYQDDTDLKPSSLVCDMDLTLKTYELALERKQIQPVIFW